jgi:hypothetical protein
VTISKGAPRGFAYALVALVATLAIAACGSSSSNSTSTKVASAAGGTSTTGSGAFAAQRQKLDACLKSHGVTLPTRRFTPGTGTTPGGGAPGGGGGGGGGFLFGGGGGGGAGRGAFRNSKDAKAFQACRADLGFRGGAGRFGGGFRPHFSKTVIDNFVACVRKNGYNLPTPNTSGTGAIFPSSLRNNPTFLKAAKACESILTAGFRGGAGGAPGGGAPPGGTSTT